MANLKKEFNWGFHGKGIKRNTYKGTTKKSK